MRFVTINKKVACTPPEQRSMQIEVRGGVAIIKQKNELLKLSVVFDNDSIFARGNTVYLKGDSIKLSWASDIYEKDGVEFILVPADLILAMEHETDDGVPF